MRLLRCFCIVLFLLISMENTFEAQEAETIYAVTINCGPACWLNQEWGIAVLERANQLLDDYDIALVQNDWSGAYPTILEIILYKNQTLEEIMHFIVGVDGEREAIPVKQSLRDISPILLHRFTPHIIFEQSMTVTGPTDAAVSNMIAGLTLYVANNCDVAIPFLQSVKNSLTVVSERQEVEGYLNFYLGNCAILVGDLDQASQLFQHSLETFNGEIQWNVGLSNNLAWVHLQNGHSNLAFDLMAHTLSSTSGSPNSQLLALVHRSQLYALDFRYNEAIADVDAAIALMIDKDDELRNGVYSWSSLPELYVLRGQMVMLLYEWDRVLADYNTALELDPTYADAYFYRGVLYYSVLEREQALADFEYYLELAPEGDHVAEATRYAESILAELEALDG